MTLHKHCEKETFFLLQLVVSFVIVVNNRASNQHAEHGDTGHIGLKVMVCVKKNFKRLALCFSNSLRDKETTILHILGTEFTWYIGLSHMIHDCSDPIIRWSKLTLSFSKQDWKRCFHSYDAGTAYFAMSMQSNANAIITLDNYAAKF